MFIECYDVGGTWIRAAVFDSQGAIIRRKKEKTEQDFCEQIARINQELDSGAEVLSIAVPGPVQDNVLLKAPPLGLESAINVQNKLGGLNKRIVLGNDLNAAVEAEFRLGAGRYYRNFYLVTFSTGIGGGIVLNGNPLSGTSGEFGHNVLERRKEFAFQCGCGNYGCWATVSSGKGIENLGRKIMGRNLTAAEIFQSSDEKAREVVTMVRDYNAQGIGMMLNALAVEKIVIMGSLGLAQFDRVIPREKEIQKYTVNPVVPIERTLLGDDICLTGSYLLAQKLK